MHLILTGEKRDPELVRALSTFSDASTEFVALDELSGVKRRDDTHVVLILHKQPGAAPLRLFASLDGDLRHHRDTLMAWADGLHFLIRLADTEFRSLPLIEDQVAQQLPDTHRGDKGYAIAPPCCVGLRLVRVLQRMLPALSARRVWTGRAEQVAHSEAVRWALLVLLATGIAFGSISSQPALQAAPWVHKARLTASSLSIVGRACPWVNELKSAEGAALHFDNAFVTSAGAVMASIRSATGRFLEIIGWRPKDDECTAPTLSPAELVSPAHSNTTVRSEEAGTCVARPLAMEGSQLKLASRL